MNGDDEAIRVYRLAKKLDIDKGRLLEICRSLDIDVKNQLSKVTAEQSDAIKAYLEPR